MGYKIQRIMEVDRKDILILLIISIIGTICFIIGAIITGKLSVMLALMFICDFVFGRLYYLMKD